MSEFKYVSLREKRLDEKKKKYIKMYNDVMSKVDWSIMASKYGYKNAHSAKCCYYSYVVPFLKKYDK